MAQAKRERDAYKLSLSDSSSASNSNSNSNSEPESPEPQVKRSKTTLKFSIDSIMESSGRLESPELDRESPGRLKSEESSKGSASSHLQEGRSRKSGKNLQLGAGGSSGQPEASDHQQQQQQQQQQHQQSNDSPLGHSSPLSCVECVLDNKDMWDKFEPLDTEMIITKQGRRMFPPVRVNFSLSSAAGESVLSQLNPRDKYQVLMDILPYDNKRYRYAYHKSSWQQAGKADPASPTKLFLHPDGPFTLDQLRRQVISFEKIKLTNNDANKHGYIVLNSMHKYQPRIHLVVWRGRESQNLANSPIASLDKETHKTFIFSETIFTAVTAYQNHSITKLKIDSNPFAKGFRDSSRLTDLELESMQDLIADGQYPFSPTRAPQSGFPHFLVAAAHAAVNQHPHHQYQQQVSPSLKEDPNAALLRERTLMSLESFLQQQQQQLSQQLHQANHNHNNLSQSHLSAGSQTSSASPTSRDQLFGPLIGGQMPPTSASLQSAGKAQLAHPNSTGGPQQPPPPPHQLVPGANFFGAFLPHNQLPSANQQSLQHQHQQQQQHQQQVSFEQLILQQQQQFAAAMAAAAAASGAHNTQQLQAFMAAHQHQQMANLSMQLDK